VTARRVQLLTVRWGMGVGRRVAGGTVSSTEQYPAFRIMIQLLRGGPVRSSPIRYYCAAAPALTRLCEQISGGAAPFSYPSQGVGSGSHRCHLLMVVKWGRPAGRGRCRVPCYC